LSINYQNISEVIKLVSAPRDPAKYPQLLRLLHKMAKTQCTIKEMNSIMAGSYHYINKGVKDGVVSVEKGNEFKYCLKKPYNDILLKLFQIPLSVEKTIDSKRIKETLIKSAKWSLDQRKSNLWAINSDIAFISSGCLLKFLLEPYVKYDISIFGDIIESNFGEIMESVSEILDHQRGGRFKPGADFLLFMDKYTIDSTAEVGFALYLAYRSIDAYCDEYGDMESYRLLQRKIRKVLTDSINWIISQQEKSGGWKIIKRNGDKVRTLSTILSLILIKETEVRWEFFNVNKEKAREAMELGEKWLYGAKNGEGWGFEYQTETKEVTTAYAIQILSKSSNKKYKTIAKQYSQFFISKLPNETFEIETLKIRRGRKTESEDLLHPSRSISLISIIKSYQEDIFLIKDINQVVTNILQSIYSDIKEDDTYAYWSGSDSGSELPYIPTCYSNLGLLYYYIYYIVFCYVRPLVEIEEGSEKILKLYMSDKIRIP